MQTQREVVIVEGVRTPFVRSNKTFLNLSAFDLGSRVLQGLMAKTGIDHKAIEHVSMGTVVHDSHTPNVARECVLGADFSESVVANTVSMACISSNVASTQIADMIRVGNIDVGIFAGVDTCSDPPIRVSKKIRIFVRVMRKRRAFPKG